MKRKYKVLRLILGDQLNLQHSWYSEVDSSILYVLMEVRTETDYAWHHIQKAVAFFAAMENFAAALTDKGHQVHYIKLDDPDNVQNFGDNCNQLIGHHHIEAFQYQLPDEYRLDVALSNYCTSLTIETKAFDTEHFFSKREELGQFFPDKDNLLMEPFYRHMRRKHHLLMDGDEPVGGKWNFDIENRKKLPSKHRPDPPYLFSNDVSAQYKRILDAEVKTIGTIRPKSFFWPLDRQQSLQLLRHFTSNCLRLFGTFQDAMHADEWSLYHSRLSFCMNTKMLSPHEVIATAIKAWEDAREEITLNQLEGFIRQILGWREYMRGIYWLRMPAFATLNQLHHRRNLPQWYWTGDTKMNCLSKSIHQSLNHAYAHHIQRLMITGNFALLCGIHPDQVDFWYLGIYIDAIEWVEITNTRGMSQYADGGITGSKPYTGSANYIHNMSNYCERCSYDRKAKTGEKSCPFNSLYWDFHDRHRAQLEHHPRLTMVYKIWDGMPATLRAEVLERANYCLSHLNSL